MDRIILGLYRINLYLNISTLPPISNFGATIKRNCMDHANYNNALPWMDHAIAFVSTYQSYNIGMPNWYLPLMLLLWWYTYPAIEGKRWDKTTQINRPYNRKCGLTTAHTIMSILNEAWQLVDIFNVNQYNPIAMVEFSKKCLVYISWFCNIDDSYTKYATIYSKATTICRYHTHSVRLAYNLC